MSKNDLYVIVFDNQIYDDKGLYYQWVVVDEKYIKNFGYSLDEKARAFRLTALEEVPLKELKGLENE